MNTIQWFQFLPFFLSFFLSTRINFSKFKQKKKKGAIVKCVQDEHPPLPSGISKELEDLLLRCFQKDIDKRASAKELLDHPWFLQNKEREKKVESVLEDKNQKVQSIKVYGESIRADSPSKSVYLTNSTTCEEVVQIVLRKYHSNADPSSYAMYLDFEGTGGYFYLILLFLDFRKKKKKNQNQNHIKLKFSQQNLDN